ncbi:ferrous iron transport protein B [candidate division KSB1 bacterium]|nr:ferrous iron transport protein B [candidate division KSB1 bacterium]NIR69361.1 ferrous iron transport protein B [candidate division KSB1 bacterium]NIS24179.1 ferrous iron transport protein B [candidate division KSB1 bacterium]NIT71094.1 ferrous iron transport protein B [candidate division KSB1 bacterium]NIU24798.1 ferrous iron transport protein B [candidate division KSB1 bacterium]
MNGKTILVGNPNVGKSVIFGLLTGRYVTVSNYPGTTVEIAISRARYDGHAEEVVDTPGVNSLLPLSEDEEVTRNILLKEQPRLIVQVADAKNLRRSLFLTVQLAELQIPLILNLNMVDEAEKRGVALDDKKLSRLLDIPIVKTVAIERIGLSRLVNELSKPLPVPNFKVQYPEEIERSISEICAYLPNSSLSKRSLALMLLAGDTSLTNWLLEQSDSSTLSKIEALSRGVQAKLQQPMSLVINQRRLQKVEEIYLSVYRLEQPSGQLVTERLSRMSMHPFWGLPIVSIVLFCIYQFVGVFGAGTLVEFLEEVVFGKFITPWSVTLVSALFPVKLLQDLFVGEFGLFTMALSYSIAIILPVITTFFLAFSFLEDSGYLPRLAVMLNRVFRLLGLNGKAVLPMVLGLGCDTMATLTTRILESRKERILVTLLLALAIPCSAQLGVILGLLSGLSSYAVFIWLGCGLGVLVLVGYVASKALPGERSAFILELPPLRFPRWSNIVVKTIARMEWYLKEAVPLFFLGTLVLFVLAETGFLRSIETWSAPLIRGFLGLPEQTARAFLIGFMRRDYGVAGLFDMARQGILNPEQILVSVVTITLFVPCIANFFVIIKERGWKTALAIFFFIIPSAFVVGGTLNFILSLIKLI